MISIERAIAQLSAGDHGGYETLREVWRGCRSAELAAELERIGRACSRPAIADGKGWHPAWIARAREGDPLDLANLLDGIATHVTPRRASMIASCLEELARHADDPQLTRPLLALLEIPAVSSAWNKVHTRIFQLLEGTGDPRAIAGLAPAIARAARMDPNFASLRDSLARAARTRDRIAKRFPAGVPPGPAAALLAELARVQPVRAAAARAAHVTDIDALLRAIYADPCDLARRAVYADALQQVGDPRGELIALQLAGTVETTAKARRLVEKHRKALLGPLAKAALNAVFEDGFLAACDTDVRRVVEAKVVFSRPEWATVKRLRFRGYAVLGPQMRALEEVRGVSIDALEGLAGVELPRLRLLGVAASDAGRGPLPALATARLPALRVLAIDHHFLIGRGVEGFRFILDAPVCAQLEEVRLPVGDVRQTLAPWIVYMRGHATLRAVRIELKDGQLGVVKEDGRLVATGTPAVVAILRAAIPGLA